MRKTLTLLTAATLLSACTTHVNRDFQMVGGSRADGTVTLALPIYSGEYVHWNWGQGQSLAEQSCRGWGYGSAQKFGASDAYQDVCVRRNKWGCLDSNAVVKYQCTGAPPPKL